jgi:1,4-dihydroxy-2-naphthoate octaprenyltransferase
MLFIYGIVSKAYSHPSVRLKRFAVTGWLIAGFFQGFFTFLLCYLGINDVGIEALAHPQVMIPAGLTSLLLWGSYPMTQVYQHEEDEKRGDRTISLRLGIMGTFHFTAVMFTIANAAFVVYLGVFHSWHMALLFELLLLPVLVFFGWWYMKVKKNNKEANFRNTMRLNLISAVCMNAYFIFLAVL